MIFAARDFIALCWAQQVSIKIHRKVSHTILCSGLFTSLLNHASQQIHLKAVSVSLHTPCVNSALPGLAWPGPARRSEARPCVRGLHAPPVWSSLMLPY